MSTAQKIIKYLAIAFAILLIVSIFQTIYYFGLVVGNYFVEDSSPDYHKTENFKTNISTLDVDLAASELIIKEGKNLKIENTNKYISIKQLGDTLKIKENSHNLINYENKSRLAIYLPSNKSYKKVTIKTGAGKVAIETLSSEKLDLAVGAGKLTISNLIVTNKADIESGAGKVTIKNGHLNNLNLEMGVGKFTLNSSLTGTSEIVAGIGALDINLLDQPSAYQIEAEKEIGSIRIADSEIKNKTTYGTGYNTIKLEGGIGSINVTFKE